MSGFLKLARLALTGAVFLAAPQPALADRLVTFGTYAPDKPSSMVRQLQPVLQWISTRASEILGETINIDLKVVRHYENGVSLIVHNEVDLARLGPASYVAAKERNPSISVLAVEKKRGRSTFNGIIAVHESSRFRSIDELRGTVFGFGNKNSTLGRFFAQLYLADAGIHAGDLKSFSYLGRHDKVGKAVGSRLVDAGALEETTFKKLVDAGVPIRAIAKMPIVTRPWVIRGGIDQSLRVALQRAMFQLSDPRLLETFRFEGFLPGKDEDYANIRRAIQENDRFFAAPG